MEKTKTQIKLFEEQKVRTVWNREREEWYFSVVDVVQILTDSKDPKQYIKKMRSRDEQLNLKGAVQKEMGSPNYFKFTREFKSAKI